jgi:hypothetical protein
MTPDSQSGSCGFEPRRGCFVWLWGSWPPRRFREPETAGSIPAGQTFVRGGEGAFLASLMSSRRGFESRPRYPRKVAACGGSTFRGVLKPALSEAAPAKPAPPAENNFGGVAQLRRALACQVRGRRFESGRPRFVVTVV